MAGFAPPPCMDPPLLRGSDEQNRVLSVCLSDSVCLCLRHISTETQIQTETNRDQSRDTLPAFVSDCPWFSVSVCPSMSVSLLLPLSVSLLLSVSSVSASVASLSVYVCLFLSLSVCVS